MVMIAMTCGAIPLNGVKHAASQQAVTSSKRDFWACLGCGAKAARRGRGL
jgi:hypothetical protein